MRVKVEFPEIQELQTEIASSFRADLEDHLEVLVAIAAVKYPEVSIEATEGLLTLGMRGTLEVIDENQGGIFIQEDDIQIKLFDGLADEFFGKINS